MTKLQLNKTGNLNHLLTTEGLKEDLIFKIFNLADSFLNINNRDIKNVPLLRGKTVCNLFFENSTRTRTTFEIAAKRLSADVINLDIPSSSQSKGESVLDTIDNLIAMGADIFIIRHSQPGIPEKIAKHVGPNVHIINAGDGHHAHPTQGLLDVFTIKKFKDNFKSLSTAIVGDIKHSRVARSEIFALSSLGVPDIRLIGPKNLMPDNIKVSNIKIFDSMEKGLRDVDVIMMLRIQKERMTGDNIPSEEDYFTNFGLRKKHLGLSKKDAIVMHPGPMNRGVEIDSEVADSDQSVILSQVTFGIAIRMAVMAMLIGKNI
jgi:aspartate carbamoyltransferase catalytic subunit